MYRSNRTPETENLSKRFSAMHFGSYEAVCALGGGGGLKGRHLMLSALRYLKFITTMLLFIGVYQFFFDY